MNQTLDIISSRYTTRSFTDKSISQNDLEKICLAALESPSSMHREPWKIICVTNKQLISELEEAGMEVLRQDGDKKHFYDSIMNRGGKLFYNAQAIIYIPIAPNTQSRGFDSAARDCGIVCQNIAIAATSLGIGSCICGLAALPLMGKDGQKFKERLCFPEGWDFGIAVLIGESAVNSTPHTPDISKIIYLD